MQWSDWQFVTVYFPMPGQCKNHRKLRGNEWRNYPEITSKEKNSRGLKPGVSRGSVMMLPRLLVDYRAARCVAMNIACKGAGSKAQKIIP